MVMAVFALWAQNGMSQPPGGGNGGGPGGGNGGGSASVTLSVSASGYGQSSGTNVVEDKTYSSSSADENIVQVTGGTFTMNNCIVTKTSGDTESNGDDDSFYGVNSALYCGESGSVLNVSGGTISTGAMGCNSVFATNSGVINIEGTTISNTKDRSRGIHATYGGVIKAANLNVTTAGTSSSVIATDRGGGTVTVEGGTYTAKGMNSAVTYSTGTISVTGITGRSEIGEAGVIEGDNTITMNNCSMTSGSTKRGLMILQSGSGDSEGYDGEIAINGGSVTLTEDGTPLLEIPTNITGTLTLTDVELKVPSNMLMYVDYNTQWSTYGGTGNLILASNDTWSYTGNVDADNTGTANVEVKKGVTWNGSIDTDNNAKSTTVTINEGVWVLTADSYIDKVVNNGTIYLNGHKLNAGNITGSGSVNEGTTGITGVATSSTKVAHFVYTLGGQRLNVDGNSLKDLPQGVYVVNGKKILVK